MRKYGTPVMLSAPAPLTCAASDHEGVDVPAPPGPAVLGPLPLPRPAAPLLLLLPLALGCTDLVGLAKVSDRIWSR